MASLKVFLRKQSWQFCGNKRLPGISIQQVGIDGGEGGEQGRGDVRKIILSGFFAKNCFRCWKWENVLQIIHCNKQAVNYLLSGPMF